MRRILLGTAALLSACLLPAQEVFAHGGVFRGPGGGLPPGMRPPSDPDPTPPPPPPPSGSPTPTPEKPGTGPVTPTPPSLPTPPAAPVTGLDPSPSGGGHKTSLTFDSWVYWYGYNRDAIEGLKDAIYTIVGTRNPLFGGLESGNRDGRRQPTAALVRDRIIPALLRVMDPADRIHPDAESAAYIALGKVARDPAHIEAIERGLVTGREARSKMTRESAALALGLLRRANSQDQFSAYEVDRVRAFLFGVFENEKEYEGRVRGFAALALGLLGDQPTGSGTLGGDGASAASATTSRIFDLLRAPYANTDLVVALLMSLGLQPSSSVTAPMRETLATCALRGRLFDAEASDVVRSFAALNLGRVGTRSDVRALRTALEAGRRMPASVVQSAAIALGTLGRLADVADRQEVARTLLTSLERVRDDGARGFVIVSLGRLLADEAAEQRTDLLEGAGVGEFLLKEAVDGKPVHRPYAALALGLTTEAIGETPDVEACIAWRGKAVETLRQGLGSRRLDERNRGAFAVALGIAKDEGSIKTLASLVSDRKEDPELRGYAAVALGLLGRGTGEVTRALRDALGERVSEEMRVQTATGLGLLGDREAVPLLLRELKEAESQSVKGQVVLALARVGDERAVEPLVSLVMDRTEKDATRALAVAGLGLVGDLESVPSLSRISRDINYRVVTDITLEVLSIL